MAYRALQGVSGVGVNKYPGELSGVSEMLFTALGEVGENEENEKNETYNNPHDSALQ